MMNTVGIDVDSKELVIVVMVNGKARKAKSYGFKKIKRRADKRQRHPP